MIFSVAIEGVIIMICSHSASPALLLDYFYCWKIARIKLRLTTFFAEAYSLIIQARERVIQIHSGSVSSQQSV